MSAMPKVGETVQWWCGVDWHAAIITAVYAINHANLVVFKDQSMMFINDAYEVVGLPEDFSAGETGWRRMEDVV